MMLLGRRNEPFILLNNYLILDSRSETDNIP